MNAPLFKLSWLSNEMAETLQIIFDYIAETGNSPSYSYIAKKRSVTKAAVYLTIRKLRGHGMIKPSVGTVRVPNTELTRKAQEYLLGGRV